MNIGALILMGGNNSRMNGHIKGHLKIGEETFLEKIISELDDFTNIYLSLNKNFNCTQIANYEEMGLSVIVDDYDDIGPLGGIYSSLKKCKEDYLFITACDMPLINKELINLLVKNINEDTDIVLCSKDKQLYPLGAVYSKTLIPSIENLITHKEYKPLKLIGNNNYIEIPIEDTNLSDDIFKNINTQDDYQILVQNYRK